MEHLDLTNIHFIVSLGASLIILLLAFFVLSKNPYAPVNKFFGAFAFCISLWAFGNALDAAALSPEISQLWTKIGGIGGILIGPMFLLFIFAFTKNYRLLNNFFTHIVLLGLSFFFYSWLTFLYPPTLEELIKMPWGWETERARDIISIFGAYFWPALLIIIGLGFCWQFWQKTKDPLEKKQSLFVIVASVIPSILYLLTGFVLPQLKASQETISLSKILFGLSSLVLVGPLAYATLKYRLFVALTPAATADTIIETIKDVLIVVNPKLKIDFLNSSTSQILDYRKDELIGQSLEFLFSPTDWKKLREKAIRRVEEKESLPALETNLLSKRGELIPVSLSISALEDKKGNLIGIVILAKDIRELIRKIQGKSSELAEKVKELEIAGQEAEKTRLATLNILEDIEEARTALQERVEELEKFNKLTVGRELRMIELKEEIKKLKAELKRNNKKK